MFILPVQGAVRYVLAGHNARSNRFEPDTVAKNTTP